MWIYYELSWVKYMTFRIDNEILSTCFEVADWPLSRILLKNNANYPWLILVPREKGIQDIDQLSPQSRYIFMEEISQLSSIVKLYFRPDKLNIGALGNIVPQLHMHIIARYKQDELWPHGVWQSAQTTCPYTEDKLNRLIGELRGLVNQFFYDQLNNNKSYM